MTSTSARFYSYLKHHLLQLTIVLVALLITSSSILSFGFALQHLIDANQFSNFQNFLLIFSIIVIFVLASFIRSYSIYAICEKVVYAIRKDAYRHLSYIAPYHFEIQKTSDIISRLTNDALIVSGAISDSFSFALRNAITAIGCIILMFYTSVKLGLYISISLPIIVLMVVVSGKKVRKLSKQNQESIALLSADIEESFNAIKTIQAANIQQFKNQNFASLSYEVLKSNLARIRVSSLLTSFIIFVALSSISLVVFLGLIEVQNGAITSGELTSFIFYALMSASALSGIANVLGDIQKSISAGERLLGLFDIGEFIEYQEQKTYIEFENIKFKDVIFIYPARPERKILDSINFEIKKGEFIGVVGKSGCGKTTIIALLEKFYNVTEGAIFLDDKNINDISPIDLRKIIGLVPQDPFIFSATAKENILIGNMNASDEEIFDAAKKAGIYDFLAGLPNGFDSYVGEKGVMLSGGQRQRIAIARAFLQKPKILLLDEATSALDAMNEQGVYESIMEMAQDITVIAIAHRIQTIKAADKILVIDQGKIIASGKHEDLLEQSLLYQELNKVNYVE